MTTWAIVPARTPADGKSRLASVLTQAERAQLNRMFFERTLTIVARVVGPHRTLAVTRSIELQRVAHVMGVDTLEERDSCGLNAALDQGALEVRRCGATAVLSVSCDLPVLSPEDLRAMLKVGGESGVVIASDRTGTGTNALLVSPIGCIPYRYGSSSFVAHVASARRASLSVRTVRRPGLAFDIDTATDLQQWLQRRKRPALQRDDFLATLSGRLAFTPAMAR